MSENTINLALRRMGATAMKNGCCLHRQGSSTQPTGFRVTSFTEATLAHHLLQKSFH
jgi:hypothetical protein